jgi:FkbM family methyltransferase
MLHRIRSHLRPVWHSLQNILFSRRRYVWRIDAVHQIRVSHESRAYANGAYDPYEPDIWPVFCQLLGPNRVFYDVGASAIGVYSLVAVLDGARRVISFEPHPNNVRKLRWNISLNGSQKRVRVMASAVGDVNGIADLISVDSTDGLHTLAPNLYAEHLSHIITVPITTLDSFVTQSGEPAPDIVKIDVEGAEVRVLRGMKQDLLPHAPLVILIELHPKAVADLGDSLEEMFSLAWANDFGVYLPNGQVLDSLPGGEPPKHIVLARSWPPSL